MPPTLFTGTRVALVTGAAQGIGRAIALRLASDGLDIAVNDIHQSSDALRTLVAELQAKGVKSISVPADVSSEEAVQEMIEKTVQELGRLDVVRLCLLWILI